MSSDKLEGASRQCDCGCGETPRFRWDDGLWLTGAYCEFYARRRLPKKVDLPPYGKASGVVPISGGPTIKTIEQLEEWL